MKTLLSPVGVLSLLVIVLWFVSIFDNDRTEGDKFYCDMVSQHKWPAFRSLDCD